MGIPPSPAGLPSAHRTVTAHRNPARRYLGRAEEYQVAVHAALQLGIVVGQQPGCGVAWQATDYVGLELVDRPVAHPRAQVPEEPHGRDLLRRQQGTSAWHDQPVSQARHRVLQHFHRARPACPRRRLAPQPRQHPVHDGDVRQRPLGVGERPARHPLPRSQRLVSPHTPMLGRPDRVSADVSGGAPVVTSAIDRAAASIRDPIHADRWPCRWG